MIEITSNILIGIGMVFIVFGSLAILMLPNFFSRLLACSQVDTVGMMLVITGVIIMKGMGAHTFKIIIILIFLLITNPITTHSIGRSAYLRGEKPERDKKRFGE